MISICMLKMSDKSICKHLEYIFRDQLNNEHFPSQRIKTNVVPFHKNDDKQILKNCRAVSLLPIYAKIFGRIIYNRISEYIIENNAITENQSRFKP